MTKKILFHLCFREWFVVVCIINQNYANSITHMDWIWMAFVSYNIDTTFSEKCAWQMVWVERTYFIEGQYVKHNVRDKGPIWSYVFLINSRDRILSSSSFTVKFWKVFRLIVVCRSIKSIISNQTHIWNKISCTNWRVKWINKVLSYYPWQTYVVQILCPQNAQN